MEKPIHTFHIPVMGIAFTIDSPIKVARYGISSVISLANDDLIENMRAFYARVSDLSYTPIGQRSYDARARRITAYLDLLDDIVKKQFNQLLKSPLEEGSEIHKYISLLSDESEIKDLYIRYLNSKVESERQHFESAIRGKLRMGDIDVNIMTKLDKQNFDSKGVALPQEYSDALAALRGFAKSKLQSSVVLSAGFNQRLYAYFEQFEDFMPDQQGQIRKKVILKVSDFRSAQIQGQFLAKKGIWVSEFRIESGLNCGGHAFPTEGYLLGPILEEFKNKRQDLQAEMYRLCLLAWEKKNLPAPLNCMTKVSVQGGIGTAEEDKFLRDHYGVDSTGWGTPFLLVPEATTVDETSLQKLSAAGEDDLYLSEASPLGVPFNNLRQTASEMEILRRIDKGRPGSPCLRKFLVSNTEFTQEPICTASREYQHNKLAELDLAEMAEKERLRAKELLYAKACLCEDLSASAYISYDVPRKSKVVPAICPGPNMAYFSRIATLQQMVDHIYGRICLLNETPRPHVFINELKLYTEYLRKEIENSVGQLTVRKMRYLENFRAHIQEGIDYYKSLFSFMASDSIQEFSRRLEAYRIMVSNMLIEPELCEV